MPGMGELMLLMVMFIALPMLGLWVWMIVDCASNEPSEGNDKLVWIIVIVVGGFIGALVYLLARRPTRKRQYGR